MILTWQHTNNNFTNSEICFSFSVVNWGLSRKSKQAFRPAMSLSTGELSAIKGKLILMTGTATTRTVRVLKNQFPEINSWKTILSLPKRENVTILVPPPENISPHFETVLEPFVQRMKEGVTYLILVRGTWHPFNLLGFYVVWWVLHYWFFSTYSCARRSYHILMISIICLVRSPS